MRIARLTLAAGFASSMAVAVLVSVAAAGPLDKSVVAADAQWVVHFDAEAARNSTIGRYVLENPGRFHFAAHMAEARLELGFDPITEFKDTTAYGVAPGNDGTVIVVSSTGAIDGLIKRLKENAAAGKDDHGPKEFHELKLGDSNIYSWREHGSTSFAYVATPPRGKADDRIVLISNSQASLQTAINVLGGTARSLASAEQGGGEGVLKLAPRPGSILYGAATGVSSWIADAAASEVLQKADSLTVDMGESGGKLYADVDLAAKTDEDATNIAKVLQGVLAMGQIVAPKKPEFARAAELASAVRFGSDGKKITIRFSYESARMLDFVKEAADASDKKHSPDPIKRNDEHEKPKK